MLTIFNYSVSYICVIDVPSSGSPGLGKRVGFRLEGRPPQPDNNAVTIHTREKPNDKEDVRELNNSI